MQALLIACSVAGALFVWRTSAGLPAVVAAHFDAAGRANGFMSHGAYVTTMLLLVTLLPVVLGSIGRLASALPSRLVNLPSREYWLASERKRSTVESLSTFGAVCAALVLGFLCYVHWLVVQANAPAAHQLPRSALFWGLAVFVIAMTAWVAALRRRFHAVA